MLESLDDAFADERAARAKLEDLMWPNGAICPRCQGGDRVYNLERIRRGLKKCGRCRKQFTIRTGTILESSHLPLIKWLQAIALTSTKKRTSLAQLQRALALDSRSARLLERQVKEVVRLARMRLRAVDAMKTPSPAAASPTAAFNVLLVAVMGIPRSRARKVAKTKRRPQGTI